MHSVAEPYLILQPSHCFTAYPMANDGLGSKADGPGQRGKVSYGPIVLKKVATGRLKIDNRLGARVIDPA